MRKLKKNLVNNELKSSKYRIYGGTVTILKCGLHRQSSALGRSIYYELKKNKTIPVNNVAKIIKIPNIGRYRNVGAIRRRGPAQTIFCLRLYYSLRTLNTKFEIISVNNVAKIIKIPNIRGTIIWELYEDVKIVLR